jgi:hypothetical protein
LNISERLLEEEEEQYANTANVKGEYYLIFMFLQNGYEDISSYVKQVLYCHEEEELLMIIQ